MLDRRVTRFILNTTEETQKTQDVVANPLAFVVTTSDFVYIGFQGRFGSRHFQMETANTNSVTLTVEYWDGEAYTAVQDVVDQTNGFTQDGFVSWTNVDDWETHQQTGISTGDGSEGEGLYYIRVSVSADLSAGTSLQSCINLFSDDNDLRVYYPELVSDTRYLPPSRTNFLEQNIAAKNLTVLRLKQRRVITDESQVIDINEVSAASVHAAAMIIIAPIDQDSDLLDRATDAFNNEINELRKSADQNKDGIVSDAEHNDFGFTDMLRR